MPDRKKILEDFEYVVRKSHGEGWDYVDGLTTDDGFKILQLLKEQETKQVKICKKEEWVGVACVCPDCKARWMGSKSETHFCPNCRRSVKWE